MFYGSNQVDVDYCLTVVHASRFIIYIGMYAYRDSLDMSCLKGFTIPGWMIEKAKKQMQSMRTDRIEPAKPKLKNLSNLVQQVTIKLTLPHI